MRWFIALILLVLTACERLPQPEPLAPAAETPVLQDCCTDLEHYPGWLAEMARSSAPVIGPFLGAIRARPGTLGDQAVAQGTLMAQARPLDLLLTSNKNRLSGRMIPGRFTHVAIYLGDEAALKRLGLWHDPLLRPHHTAIRAGRVFIESEFDGTTLLTRDEVFDTDLVALLRPEGLTPTRRRAATHALFAQLGSPFNFRFDLRDCSCTFCTQLVDLAMPWLDLPRRRVYGTETILPDDIARRALARDRLRLVGYLRGVPGAAESAGKAEVIRDMNAYWARHPGGGSPGAQEQTAPPPRCTGAGLSGPILP